MAALLLLAVLAPVAAAEKEKSDPLAEKRAAKLASLMVTEKKINATIDKLIEAGLNHPSAGQIEEQLKQQVLQQVDEMKSNFMEMLPWEKIRAAVAEEYAEHFTADELGEILAFYDKGAGKKMLELQPDLVAGMVERVATSLADEKLTLMGANYLTELEQNLGPKEKLAVLEAKTSKPFPEKLLHGKWYGRDLSDPEYKSYWWHEKKPGGKQVLGGLDLDSAEKTFDKYETPGRYSIIGRLLIETDFDEPSFSSIYIIDEVTKEKIKYRIVDEELPLAEWDSMVDRREPVEFPEIPEGYKDADDEPGGGI